MAINRGKRYSKKRNRKQVNELGTKSRYKQGYYKPINEHKYIVVQNKMNKGIPEYRSSWELKFMRYLDTNDDVKKWSSEPFYIWYFSSEDNRMRHYYPDFYVEFSNGRKIVVEIKPKAQTTLTRNQEKWEAAKKVCDERGLEFIVLTEDNLGT
jgi:hypothetical protein